MRRYVYGGAVIVLMLVIYLFSSIPHLSFFHGKLPPHLQWLNRHSLHLGSTGFFSYIITLNPDFIIHKLGHFTLYGLLGLTLYMATGRSAVKAMLIVVLFAVSDEVHQGFVIGRSSRLGDIILDTASASLFILLFIRLAVSRHSK